MAISRADIKAYLYVLNEPSVMYCLPFMAPDNLMGCLSRLREQIEGLLKETKESVDSNYWGSILKDIEAREKLNSTVVLTHTQKIELTEKTRHLAIRLYDLYVGRQDCYRKVLVLGDGRSYRLSPVPSEEYRLFSGGCLDVFKRDFGYRELSDFTEEELVNARVFVYNAYGEKLSWSSWNCCIQFDCEREEEVIESKARADKNIVD